jgi:hypothetical protein
VKTGQKNDSCEQDPQQTIRKGRLNNENNRTLLHAVTESHRTRVNIVPLLPPALYNTCLEAAGKFRMQRHDIMAARILFNRYIYLRDLLTVSSTFSVCDDLRISRWSQYNSVFMVLLFFISDPLKLAITFDEYTVDRMSVI